MTPNTPSITSFYVVSRAYYHHKRNNVAFGMYVPDNEKQTVKTIEKTDTETIEQARRYILAIAEKDDSGRAMQMSRHERNERSSEIEIRVQWLGIHWRVYAIVRRSDRRTFRMYDNPSVSSLKRLMALQDKVVAK